MDKSNNSEYIKRYSDSFKTLGTNLRIARIEKKLSLKELSTLCKYDSDLISNLESGIENVRYNKLISLVKNLDIDFKSLFKKPIENTKVFPSYIEDDYLLVFINNIQKILKRKNKEKQSLCVFSELSPSAVARLLNGNTKNPTILTLFRISDSLGINISNLFERSEI